MAVLLGVLLLVGLAVIGLGRLENALVYHPDRRLVATPVDVGLPFEDVWLTAEDGVKLHAWHIHAAAPRALVVVCHGNAGNISHRLRLAEVLVREGLDALLFDYRGYGRSEGRPDEEGTYRDARAARHALLRQPGVDGARIVYLGESIGGAVAVALAVEAPPLGLVLQSAFTSVKDMGRLHYPFIPAAVVPDAYPSLRRVAQLQAPLLVLHGDRDDIVPVAHGRALFEAAPQPKRIEIVRGAGHNDLLDAMGAAYGTTIAEWARTLARAAALC